VKSAIKKIPSDEVPPSQRVFNELWRTRLSRCVRFGSLPLPPLELTDGRGGGGDEVGKEPNHTIARKLGRPLKIL
jgi:hypothetical protein